MPSGKTLFNQDVTVEDVDPDPYQRFGGDHLSTAAAPPPPAAVRSPLANSSSIVSSSAKVPPPLFPPADAGSPKRAAPTKRSIFDAPPPPSQYGGGDRSSTNNGKGGGGAALNVSSVSVNLNTSALSNGAPRRQVMMINTDLAVGHEKTLKNTLGKKTTINSISSAASGGQKEPRSPRGASGTNTFGPPADNNDTKQTDNAMTAAHEMDDKMTRKHTPRLSALKRFPKVRKEWMRLSRTAFQFVCMFCAFLAFAICAITTASGYWIVRSDTTRDVDSWYELTTFAGPCKCSTNLKFDCATLNNAFDQVGQLSGILIGAELLLIGILLYEFCFFGIFGGPDYFTRLTLIAEVLGFATATLSLILYAMAFQQPYCSVNSFEANGFQLGWGAYVRGLEALGFFLMIVLTADAGFDSARGPPCTLLFFAVGVFALTCITTTSYGWMAQGTKVLYGITSHCECGTSCSSRTDFDGLLESTRSLSLIQTLVGLLTVFFVLLRGVDNVGATLKFAEISGAVFVLIAAAGVGNVYRFNYDAACNIPGQEDMYEPSWAMYAMVGSAGIMSIFLFLNGLYMSRFYVVQLENLILEFLPTDHPFHDWAQAYLQKQQEWKAQQEQLPDHVAKSQGFIKGVGGTAAPSVVNGVPVPHDVGCDDDRYKAGPFAAAGPRTFYQVFWWDELMSDGAMQAEELDEAFQEEEEQMATLRRSQTAAENDGRKKKMKHAWGDDMGSDETPRAAAAAALPFPKIQKVATDGAYVEDLTK